ncbi:MAG: PLP-dependent aminotransferase family protein [Planctomycetales bacterium]|nr:PLP-dependent aminotransferase family protein [Planctomycetales bacterium]
MPTTDSPVQHSASPRFSQRARQFGDQPISYLMQKALDDAGLISLAAGFVDPATLPTDATRTAVDAVLADPRTARAALQYGSNQGLGELREAVLARLLADDGQTVAEAGLTADAVVMTSGSNELLHLVSDVLLDDGDLVLCAAPSYFVFQGTLAYAGAQSYGVAIDAEGMIPAALEETFQRLETAGQLPRIKLLYVTSYFDNPSSVTLAESRRHELVEIVRRWSKHHHIYILEDIAYRPLRYEGPDIPSIRSFDEAGDRVIVAQTFSKAYSPGLRVGCGFLPRPLLAPLLRQKAATDFGSPSFSQHVLLKVLELGLLEPHVARLCQSYRAKRDVMLRALDEHLRPIEGVSWLDPHGGIYVWADLPPQVDTGFEGELFDLALDERMMYVPGQYCYPGQGAPAAKNQVRLSFGDQPAERVAEGIAALGRALRRALGA